MLCLPEDIFIQWNPVIYKSEFIKPKENLIYPEIKRKLLFRNIQETRKITTMEVQ